MCLLLTILRLESFVATGVCDLESDLRVHSWQVNANIFKVMGNAFLRDFYFSL